MRDYTRKEILSLASQRYVILIIDGLVYDVTTFLDNHPGGKQVLIGMAGQDATQKFKEVGHSIYAHQKLKLYLIGKIAQPTSILAMVGVAGLYLWNKLKSKTGSSAL